MRNFIPPFLHFFHMWQIFASHGNSVEKRVHFENLLHAISKSNRLRHPKPFRGQYDRHLNAVIRILHTHFSRVCTSTAFREKGVKLVKRVDFGAIRICCALHNPQSHRSFEHIREGDGGSNPCEQMYCCHAPVSDVPGPALGNLAPSTGTAPTRVGLVDVG